VEGAAHGEAALGWDLLQDQFRGDRVTHRWDGRVNRLGGLGGTPAAVWRLDYRGLDMTRPHFARQATANCQIKSETEH
jgi:hypothetical protein